MRKVELVAIRLKNATYANLLTAVPAAFDSLGITEDVGARDGSLAIRDHAERGCVISLENLDLAQRTARALVPVAGGPVQIFEVGGTNSGTTFKFRAAAFEATVDGQLRDFAGVELDFDDLEQTWGGGTLDARAKRVLRDFGELPTLWAQEKVIGYKRRSAGKPSSPRVSTLLQTLKKARTWEGVPQEGGRVELRLELAAGGRQTSFCSAAEFEELRKLTGRG
jgi:hypothetical protein